MHDAGKYDISPLGEFYDKSLEKEYFNYDMKRYAKLVGPVTMIFGLVYALFLIFDFKEIKNATALIIISIVRLLVFLAAVAMNFLIKRINNYTNIAYLLTGYEFIASVSFLVIISLYDSYSYLAIFSLIAIMLAVYTMPNRLIYSQIVSAFLCLSFFLYPARYIDNIGNGGVLKAAAYNIIYIIFCNIGAYLTNYYKRKEFVESRELLQLSVTDPLTGIYNRAKFNEELNRLIAEYKESEAAHCLVILDIDDFKKINDKYGHLAGDSIIQNIVNSMKKVIRSTDILARWGGEEFVILLPNTDLNQAAVITERIRVSIQKNNQEKVTCSFGLAALRKNDNAESLIRRADRLLYDAKDLGKNSIVSEYGV